MPVVHFVPLRKSREIKSGATILAAANQCSVPIGQSCSGDGICGWCRVRVVEGLEHLGAPTSLEQRLMEERKFNGDERAACLACFTGDVTVTTDYW